MLARQRLILMQKVRTQIAFARQASHVAWGKHSLEKAFFLHPFLMSGCRLEGLALMFDGTSS